MRPVRYIDPDPLTLGLSIIGATAGVVKIIDMIRRARDEAEEKAQQAEAIIKQTVRDDRREQREIEQLEIERAKILRPGIQRVGAVLDSMHDQTTSMQQILNSGERCENSWQWKLAERDFYRYCEYAIGLSEANTKILKEILALEPNISLPEIYPEPPAGELIRRRLNLDAVYLAAVDETYYDYDEEELKEIPLRSVINYIKFARSRIDGLLESEISSSGSEAET